jgi:hypothetical protein
MLIEGRRVVAAAREWAVFRSCEQGLDNVAAERAETTT